MPLPCKGVVTEGPIRRLPQWEEAVRPLLPLVQMAVLRPVLAVTSQAPVLALVATPLVPAPAPAATLVAALHPAVTPALPHPAPAQQVVMVG